ncbi:MAG: leucine--tRNA ligase [Candidatus Methanomethylophilaceae archaeon]|jgi:leucyl-tRNA synthetase
MAQDHIQIEKKWQTRWSEEHLGSASRNERPKFMIIFAYPGVTGYLHVGHLRGYTYADAIGRYKRMLGYNVMFPVGTHATGNGAISLARKIQRGDPGIIEYMEANGCPKDKLKELTDPHAVVEFFNDVYVNDYWKRFGFLADWRRFTCSVYPDYGKFVEWQFRKLNEKGLLIQKPYYAPFCPDCGPVAVDQSETDLSKGGNAEVQEFTLLKFDLGEFKLLAATLRPETVFGQVCVWVNPDTEYAIVKHGKEKWVVSSQALEKLTLQFDGIEAVGTLQGRDIIGWTCRAPMVGRIVRVLPAAFCDPAVGTGIVSSVPSDSPDDWINLKYIKEHPEEYARYGLTEKMIADIKPVSIISMEGYGDFPAKDAVESLGITSADDPKLEIAKKQVYKDGFHTGRMKDSCGPFSGMRVDEAKEKIKETMIKTGEAEVLYDLSEEVVCRCGRGVRIKRVDDQWFIDYGREDLTEKTKKHTGDMEIYPAEYASNVNQVLDWFRERACVRQGNWLGTKFPFDDKWIIEAISDSTLYPLYYVISIYANSGNIKPENMTEEFFDYVILGKGNVSDVSESTKLGIPLLENIRGDVEYWYPLDINLGGKEHMTVHFPVFLFNHSALLPDNMQPRGILVNWYVTGKKTKISKSKGGAQPIPGAIETFGTDAMRLYYSHIASMFVDVEWNEENVMMYKQRLERIFSFAESFAKTEGKPSEIDRWLISRFQTHIADVRRFMDKYDLRQTATTVYYEMFNDLRWYVRRGGSDPDTAKEVLGIWIRSMMPITPHMAEELWENAGFEGLVSSAEYPEPEGTDAAAEYGEELIRSVISDVAQIKKVAGADAERIILYTAAPWKRKVYSYAADMAESGELTVPGLTKLCMSDPEIRGNGKAASELAKKTASDWARKDASAIRITANSDEYGILSEASEFLSGELGLPVKVFRAGDSSVYDPKGKSAAAVPGRPAILLE